MDAIYYKEGVIRPVVAVVKSLASALSIGTAPPSAVKVRSSRSARQSAPRSAKSSTWAVAAHHAVAAGAGAGIAATFNTPIGA